MAKISEIQRNGSEFINPELMIDIGTLMNKYLVSQFVKEEKNSTLNAKHSISFNYLDKKKIDEILNGNYKFMK